MNRPEQMNRGGGALGFARDLAMRGSLDRRWERDEEQNVWLQRRATINSVDFDSVEAIYEAHKLSNGRGGAYPFYRIRVEGMRQLVSEELPTGAKALIDRANVSTSLSEEIYATPSMAADDEVYDDDDDDRTYLHNVSVEYRMNGRGQMLDRVHQDSYWVDDEELVVNRLAIPGRQGIAQELNGVMASIPKDQSGVVKLIRPRTELREDMKFLEIVSEHRNNPQEQQRSEREHRQSMIAIMAFIVMEGEIGPVIDLL